MQAKAATWTSPIKRRQFFKKFARDNGFDFLSANAWYAQTKSKVLSTKGGFAVIEHHRCSVSQALIDLFPEIGLEKRGFQAKKWYSKKERRLVFEKYAQENKFDFLSPSAWYSQSYLRLTSFKGIAGVLGHYNNNIQNALLDLFPEIGLEKSRFKVNPQQFAKIRQNFFDNFAKSRDFDPLIPDNWYTVPISHIIATRGGISILSQHDNSLIASLTKSYPGIGLDKHKFIAQRKINLAPKPKVTTNSNKRQIDFVQGKKKWYSRKKRRNFFENYARRTGFDYLSPDAWYLQTYSSILSFKKSAEVLKYYKNNISEALVDLFPEIILDKSKFKSHLMQSSPLPLKPEAINQDYLTQVVQDLFLPANIVNNSRKKSQVTNPTTGNFYEIDTWVPNLQLGFEYQDMYHYVNTWYSHYTLAQVQLRDASKKSTVTVTGTTLVQVPCWWDGAPGSLASSIHFERPELLSYSSSDNPIPLNPAPGFFTMDEVPGIGALMLASFPLNPDFSNTVAGRTWWMGEKYDGMRCCWNPEKREVYSRSGKRVPLPSCITIIMPKVFIDGEFWFGRGMFSSVYLLIHGNSSWLDIRMLSFDYPLQSLHRQPFEKRYQLLLNSILPDHAVCIVAQRILCEGSEHLNLFIGKVIEYGGEGMILRRVGSRYQQGRNKNLIKLKTSFGDSEGLVVGSDPKAITLKLPNGHIFDVPMQNVHVKFPPLQVGEVVTFSYENLSRRDVPAHAEIFRRRSELKWEEVVANSQFHHIPDSEPQNRTFTSKPRGFWTYENMREYMSNFAKNLNLDPLIPATWSKIPLKLLFDTAGGTAILKKYKEPLIALSSLFPDVSIQTTGRLQQSVKTTYSSALKRRNFFEKYARANGFDPLVPSAWYSHPRGKIADALRGTSVLGHHENSVLRALIDLFPDVGLEESKFKKRKILV